MKKKVFRERYNAVEEVPKEVEVKEKKKITKKVKKNVKSSK